MTIGDLYAWTQTWKSAFSAKHACATPRNTSTAIADARLAIHFRNQVRGRHIERDPGRKRQRIRHRASQQKHQSHTRSVAPPRIAEDMNATRRLCPLASISDATVNPSGILCRKIARKITAAEPRRNQQPRRDGHAVEKRVDHQAQQRRIARVRVGNLLVMRLFAKVKMRRQRCARRNARGNIRRGRKENRVRRRGRKIEAMQSLRSFTDSGIISSTPSPA